MGNFFNALFQRTTLQPSSVDPATVGQPVPVAMITEPPNSMSSTSAINNAAVGAWPDMIDAGYRFDNNGWRPSVLREVSTTNVSGNYGAVTSKALFGFRSRAFGGIGNSPGPIPNPYRPMYDDLIPITWGLRVGNPNIVANATAQKGPITIQNNSSTWVGTNTASLSKTGTTLL